MNLCTNAVQAMEEGGALTVVLEPVPLHDRRILSHGILAPGRYVRLSVSDTGSGIPPAVFERMFDPFFTTKEPESGTGLGLSTVLTIVKSHGGFIQIDSLPERGSTFRVYIPVARDTAVAAETPRAAGIRGRQETILYVDDEAAVREVAWAVLDRLGFRPVTAADGAEALNYVEVLRSDIRVVITDVHMPHMDGLAFLRELRKTMPSVPVIVASGRLDEQAAADFASLGTAATLHKPFTEEDLIEALATALNLPAPRTN
jgi:CheY-like chemotaxis protein